MRGMIAFKDLADIHKITLQWESKLKDFYDVAEFALKSHESKRLVAVLRDRLVEKLEVLRNVDLKSFGRTEWVRYAAGYRDEELIPVGKIHREAAPAAIFAHLLDYEEKLRGTYASIASNLVSRTQKELFESLARFKAEQIEEIRRLRDVYAAGV